MVIAVAISIGIRRVLSRENIYTIKLARFLHQMVVCAEGGYVRS
jgi:hypothetical protein